MLSPSTALQPLPPHRHNANLCTSLQREVFACEMGKVIRQRSPNAKRLGVRALVGQPQAAHSSRASLERLRSSLWSSAVAVGRLSTESADTHTLTHVALEPRSAAAAIGSLFVHTKSNRMCVCVCRLRHAYVHEQRSSVCICVCVCVFQVATHAQKVSDLARILGAQKRASQK